MLSQIELDAAHLRHNYREFCRLLGKERTAPVLKSNAYGHGLAEAYAILAPMEPAWLCVNYVGEAELLRRLGFRGRLLVVGPAVPREFRRAAAAKAEIIVGNSDLLRGWLAQAAAERPLIHLKFDTGMARQGFASDEAQDIASQLVSAEARAQVVAACTHFANVEDVSDQSYAVRQLHHFKAANAALAAAGLELIVHAASSASSLILDRARFDLCRVGISLYGVWPSPLTRVSYLQLHGELADLRPVLSWRSEITAIKPVGSGDYIGYGCTYRAVRDMRVAIVPVGYYEGYPRIAGEHASYVLIRGRRCPLVGRICMNMFMVDVTHVPSATAYDRVTLLGRDGDDAVGAHDLANWAQTIHYELLARLHPAIPRHVVESAASG